MWHLIAAAHERLQGVHVLFHLGRYLRRGYIRRMVLMIRELGLFICMTTLVATGCQGKRERESQPPDVAPSEETIQSAAPGSEQTTTETDPPSPQTETIGQWRDYLGTFWDHNLRLVQEDNQYIMIGTPTRGNPFRRELVEVAAAAGETRRFQVEGADDIYTIQADGHLGLHDRDGPIRVAKKIP